MSNPSDAQCLELRIRTAEDSDPVLLRFRDARTAEDWREKCHFNKKLQVMGLAATLRYEKVLLRNFSWIKFVY